MIKPSTMKSDFDTMFSEHKSSITVRDITKSYDDRGDATESYTDYDKYAIVIIDTRENRNEPEGIVEYAEGTAFFKTDDSSVLKKENKIQHNSNWYIIKNLVTHKVAGTDIFIKCAIKKT